MEFPRSGARLASLNHPNIVAIYGVEDRALVMEWVEGPTLAERIVEGPIPLEETPDIARRSGMRWGRRIAGTWFIAT
jgi:serine/threonine-protein kinase